MCVCIVMPCAWRVSVRNPLDFLFVAGRCGLRARSVRCGPGCWPPRAGICGARRAASQDMAKYAWRGGPNDIVAGRVRAQLFQPTQFVSKCAHRLCLLVGGLPDSSLCV